MEAPQLTEHARRRLAAIVGDAHVGSDRLLPRLRELRDQDGVAACSAALRLLAHLEMSEEKAEQLLEELLRHREQLASALGRDPGLHVAAIDFLFNLKRLITSPTVIENAQLEKTERSAMTDPLTAMFNRRYFDGALDVEIRRSRRYSLAMSLLLLDLDFFKSVNDIYGHVFGDLVLRRAGQIVRRAVRESDVACRFGGDEFAVVLPETDRLGAFAVAERIRRRIEFRFANTPLDGRLVAMTVSGGLSVYAEDGTTGEALIERADQALYQAKSQGKNSVVIHHAERRRAVRFPVKPTTRAEIAAGPSQALFSVQPVNLSRGGALLETGPVEPLAGAVELTLWEDNESWRVPGRVVRVEEPAGRGARRVAVAFDQPLPENCLRRNVLASHPPRAQAGGPV
jgi:diguanylate cyclase (GGDEF)-like protein